MATHLSPLKPFTEHQNQAFQNSKAVKAGNRINPSCLLKKIDNIMVAPGANF